jgi:hypothetical protein
VDSWTPAELFAADEVGVWYDPSDFDTMWKDTAGTTPVTAVDDLVARIDDKSGNGFHATQATEANRPVLKQDGNGNYYLLFDGVNDCMVTSSIDFTATDKMSVFSGIRKLVDSTGMLAELSSIASNTGAFGMQAPNSATNSYRFESTGTTIRATDTTGFSAPITSVVTGFGDISGDISRLRVNGTQTSQNTNDQGSGNFGNYVLNIGSRNGTDFRYNGHIYSLIVRGASSTSDEIDEAEAWVNGKTEAY